MNKALSETVYERLTDVEDARVCAEISAAACRETPGNFVLTLVAQFLTKLADAVASPKLVLAWVLTAIQAPVGLTGLLVPIRESGSLIPQLLIASYVRRLPLRKWAWVVGSVIQAIAIAAIGAVALSLEGAMAGWAIIACLVVFSLARGLCSVAAKDVLGKTIPKSKRGQVAGLSASAAGLVTVALGLVLMYADTGAGTTTLYGGLILTAAALWLLAAMVYSRITEFPGETGGGGNALYEAVKRLDLLRSDRAFRRFVITRALLLCSALLAPYFVVLAQQQHGASPDLLGLFVVAAGLASLLSGPLWGRFADRSSRLVMVVSATLAGATGAAVFAAHQLTGLTATLWFMPLAFFVLGIAHDGVRVGRKTYVIDLAGGNRRTDYVAVSNSVIGAILLLAGLTGAMSSVLSVAAIILLLSLLGIAGALLGRTLPEVE